MGKQKIIACVLLLILSGGTLSGCNVFKSADQKASESRSISKSTSYSNYVSVQKEKSKVTLDVLNQKYTEAHNEMNTILYRTNDNNGIYHSVDKATFTLQAAYNNSFNSKSNKQQAYQRAQETLQEATANVKEVIEDNNSYRDNKLLKELNKFYAKDLILIKMNKQKVQYLAHKNKNDNSADIELYKTKVFKQYQQVDHLIRPILEQANYESQSADYKEAQAQQWDNKEQQHFGQDNTRDKNYGPAVNGSDSHQAEKELNKYNVQLPNAQDSGH